MAAKNETLQQDIVFMSKARLMILHEIVASGVCLLWGSMSIKNIQKWRIKWKRTWNLKQKLWLYSGYMGLHVYK